MSDAELVKGGARDQDALARALVACDAVISSLGTGMSAFRNVTFLSWATTTLIAAMNRSHVRRLVCISGMGAGDSRWHGGFLYDRLGMPLLLRNVYYDKDRQEDAIHTSSLDWVIVRPAMLTEEPAWAMFRASLNWRVSTAARLPEPMSRASSWTNRQQIHGWAEHHFFLTVKLKVLGMKTDSDLQPLSPINLAREQPATGHVSSRLVIDWSYAKSELVAAHASEAVPA